jgi:glycosyltransferase involved in cell wall biosynthesis/aminoglycoside phosphotransferase (APT) family kinase protein
MKTAENRKDMTRSIEERNKGEILPLVSVIIPVYNGERYIEKCLQSVLSQTYKNLEIIVVNDGSTDNTGKIIMKYSPTVLCLEQDNKGVGQARNTGIRTARGDYIAFLDADDLWEADKVARQMDIFPRYPSVIAIGCARIDIDSEGVVMSHRKSRYTGRPINMREILLCKGPVVGLSLSCLVVLKTSLLDAGLFPEDRELSEDYDCWIRLANKGDFYILPDALCKYRITSNSAIHSSVDRTYSSQVAILERYRDFLTVKQYQRRLSKIMTDWGEEFLFQEKSGAIEKFRQALSKNPWNLTAWWFLTKYFGKKYFLLKMETGTYRMIPGTEKYRRSLDPHSDCSYFKLLLDLSSRGNLFVFDDLPSRSPLGLSRHFSLTVWMCKDEQTALLVQRELQIMGYEDVYPVVGDISRLPFGYGSFDAVCLHRLSDSLLSKLDKIIPEASRLLSKTGVFYVSLNGEEKQIWVVRSIGKTVFRLCAVANLKLRAQIFFYLGFSPLYFLRLFWAEKGLLSPFTSLMKKAKYDMTMRSRGYIFSANAKVKEIYQSITPLGKIKTQLEVGLKTTMGSPQIVRVGSGGGAVVDFGPVIVRLPMTEEGRARCLRNKNTLEALGRFDLPLATPKFVMSGTVDGQQYFAESKLSGLSLDLHKLSVRQTEGVEKTAFELISDMRRIKTGILSRGDILGRLQNETERLRPFLRSPAEEKLSHILLWANRTLGKNGVVSVLEHGDYKQSNFLVSGKLRRMLSGLIDWDLSNLLGLPLTDAITLRVYSGDYGSEGSYILGLKKLILSGKTDRYLSEYCQKMAIDSEDAKVLLTCALLKHLNMFPMEEKEDQEWYIRVIEGGFLPIIATIEEEGFQLVSQTPC